MESAHLIQLKYANASMQHAAFMEQEEILFLPVVRIHKLNIAARE